MAKWGIEVEGRLQGLATLFLGVEELPFVKEIIKNVDHKIQQIYISDNFNLIDIDDKDLKELSSDYIITLERTEVPVIIPNHINIMLSIENESFWNLRPQDQIKFSKNLTVYSVTHCNMTLTNPEDFEGDINV